MTSRIVGAFLHFVYLFLTIGLNFHLAPFLETEHSHVLFGLLSPTTMLNTTVMRLLLLRAVYQNILN